MPVVSTGRKHASELLKGYSAFEDQAAINFHFATVDVEDSGNSSIDNIGTLVKWSNADSAFIPFVVNADRADSTAYSVGDVVKLVAQDGLEYVAVAAGTSAASAPTFVAIEGATTVDGTVTWMARSPYGVDPTSPLPSKQSLAVTIGSKEGLGRNKEATTLSATATKMTVLFRGQAAIVEEGIEGFDSLAAADQADVKVALEKAAIVVDSSADVANPSYVVA